MVVERGSGGESAAGFGAGGGTGGQEGQRVLGTFDAHDATFVGSFYSVAKGDGR